MSGTAGAFWLAHPLNPAPSQSGRPNIIGDVPTLSPSESGILLPTAAAVSGQQIRDAYHSREEIMSALLLWDVIAYPTNTAITIMSGDVAALRDLGALKVVNAQLSGGAETILAGERAVFDRLLETSPNRWAVLPAAGGRFIRPGDLTEHGGAAFSLYNALPVPTREVPFEDVMEFRHHRQAELIALRAHINGLADEIGQHADQEAELQLAVEKLDRSISDQIRVTREAFGAFSLIRLKVGFNAGDAFKEGAFGGGAAAFAQQELPNVMLAAGIAGLRAGLKFDLDLEGFKMARGHSPFQYVVNAHSELG